MYGWDVVWPMGYVCILFYANAVSLYLSRYCPTNTDPFKLPLSARAIFLDRHRPLFLCEKMLDQIDAESIRKRTKLDLSMGGQSTSRRKRQRAIVALEDPSEHKSTRSNVLNEVMSTSSVPTLVSQDINNLWPGMKKSPSLTFNHDIKSIFEGKALPETDAKSSSTGGALQDRKPKPSVTASNNVGKRRSSTALLGAYTNLQKNNAREKSLDCSGRIPLDNLIESAIQERKWTDSVRTLFAHLDKSGNGALSKEEFVAGYHKLKPDLSIEQLNCIFDRCDVDDNGSLSLAEFIHMVKLPQMDIAYMMFEPSIRDANGVIQVQASNETYFGENVMKGVSMNQFTQNSALTGATKSQDFSQEVYEARIASMQRFVAMTVMFHQMGWQVERFFRRLTFGLLGYRFDRTQR